MPDFSADDVSHGKQSVPELKEFVVSMREYAKKHHLMKGQTKKSRKRSRSKRRMEQDARI